MSLQVAGPPLYLVLVAIAELDFLANDAIRALYRPKARALSRS
jgi:hypothetical protein